jgi:hypothetical protein
MRRLLPAQPKVIRIPRQIQDQGLLLSISSMERLTDFLPCVAGRPTSAFLQLANMDHARSRSRWASFEDQASELPILDLEKVQAFLLEIGSVLTSQK